MTADLVQFLRARLDEDEQVARGHEQWSASWHQDDCVNEIRDDENAGTVAHVFRLGDRTHIARHDPARVLAEVDAKRQALAHYERVQQHMRKSDGGDDYIFAAGAVSKQIQYMALAWADHPDYREEWKP